MYVCECLYNKWINIHTGKREEHWAKKEEREKNKLQQIKRWQLQVVKIIGGERLCQ
jgi:hypothetical protein